MFHRIRNPKDFWAGILYLCFGISAFWLGQDYSIGLASRMGPGYFPRVLSVLMMFFGILSLGRSLYQNGPSIGRIAWKQALIILASTVAFGLLLQKAGLVIALLILIFGSASASKFRIDRKICLMSLIMIVSCALIFVKGLGLPMPLFGRWFGI